MCKTLKVEVPASFHIPLTPSGLAGIQSSQKLLGFGNFTKRISVKFSPFPLGLPLYSVPCNS